MLFGGLIRTLFFLKTRGLLVHVALLCPNPPQLLHCTVCFTPLFCGHVTFLCPSSWQIAHRRESGVMTLTIGFGIRTFRAFRRFRCTRAGNFFGTRGTLGGLESVLASSIWKSEGSRYRCHSGQSLVCDGVIPSLFPTSPVIGRPVSSKRVVFVELSRPSSSSSLVSDDSSSLVSSNRNGVV